MSQELILLANILLLLANLGVLALGFKLYTEFAKERMQSKRQEKKNDSGV